MHVLLKKAITVGVVVTSAALSASVFALDITGAGATLSCLCEMGRSV
jgi:hypothetical protein